MPVNKPTPIPPEVALRLAEIVRRLPATVRRNVTSAEEIDNAVRELHDLLPLLGAAADTLPLRVQLLCADAARAERRRLQKEQARHGAISMNIVPQADDHALLEIDGRPGVLLPQSLAALARVLTADGGAKADQFVGFKSFLAIQSALKEQTGKSLGKKAIKELVLRLRDLLETHGESRYFVENKRSFGYRFRLRRGNRDDGGITVNDHR